jgi:undecaprenyl-diphosphatase
MATALAYLMVVPDAWRPAVVGVGGALVLAVGCSVVVLHYHYPSDVLGGWLIATAWFFALAARSRPGHQVPLGGPRGQKGVPLPPVDRL